MFRDIWCVVVTGTLLSLQCSAQTYPYTTPSPAEVQQAYPTSTYLYDAGFTVFGNIKTIAVAAHGQDTTPPTVPSSVPTIEVYEASYSYPSISPAGVNSYSLAATLNAKNTDGTTDATRLGYAIEGGQSVKTSDIIVGTTIYDSAGGLYSAGVGAAYVFKQFTHATWSQAARLQPSDLTDGTNDKFGASVAVDEFNPTRVMVGAPYAGDSNSGAVYFYESSPTAKYWTQGQKLLPSVQSNNGRFGDEIEIYGRFAAITEPDTCQVYIFEQERAKPKPKPKTSCGSSPAPAPAPVTTPTWTPLVQHETLRWSQQQILFTDQSDFECNVGGRSETYGDLDESDFDSSPTQTHDPQYGNPDGSGYGGYLSISMFDDTLAVGVPGYEDSRIRTDYRDSLQNPDLCNVVCTYDGTPGFAFNGWSMSIPANQNCCPSAPASPGVCPPTSATPQTVPGGQLYLGQCPGYPYAPGDNGRVYMFDMETFKGDCDRENYFPTALSFDELVSLRDTEKRSDDDDCHSHKPKPKPQCEVSRWSQQTYLTSPSGSINAPALRRYSDCQNFGYKVDVYKDVVTINEVNTLSYDIYASGNYDPFNPSPSPLPNEYHCMSNLYYPLYDEDVTTDQPLQKQGFVYAYEKTSSNTWAHIGGSASYYEINTNPTGIEAANAQVVGTDVFTMESSSGGYDIDVQTTDNNWQCMVVTLMDQFGDGWGGAELQITDSDGRKQSFAPYCDSPPTSYPFVYDFRWCPDDWDNGNEVKMEILHSPSTKFRWELEWSVYFEWNQRVVYGDWQTKMTLWYDTVGSQILRLKHAERLVNTTAACQSCDLYTARPTGAPTSKPVRPKPKPKPPTKSPTPSSSKKSNSLSMSEWERDVNTDMEDNWSNEYDNQDVFDVEDTEEILESSQTHLRRLHHKTKTAVRTHTPTVSPAPTLPETTAFTTWEQIYLYGSVAGSGGRAGWDRPYTVDSYAAANIPMKYFVSDKEGKHLYYEGTKCVADDIVCWTDLPHGDRDYILRVGGAATLLPDPSPPDTWSMCGRNGGEMEQLDFRVRDYITSNLNEAECDGLLHATRAVYCQNTLDLVVPTSGIIVLEGLSLDSFSQLDLDLLGHAISLLFSPTKLLEVTFSQQLHSSRGAHVGFTIEVPSSTFGLDATAFDTVNATIKNTASLLQAADLTTSVDALLLDYSALDLESSLGSHGRIYIEDVTAASEAKTTYVRNPFYYVDDDAESADVTLEMSNAGEDTSILYQLITSIENHMVAFLVLVVGGTVLYVRRRSQDVDEDILFNERSASRKSDKKSRKSKSSVSLPFDDREKHSHDRKSKRESRRSRNHRHQHRGEEATGELLTASVPASHRDDQASQRFVPYGSAVEEGWTASGRVSAIGSAVRGPSTHVNTSSGEAGGVSSGANHDEDDLSDELDHILSHFDSSSDSSGSGSDDWEHA